MKWWFSIFQTFVRAVQIFFSFFSSHLNQFYDFKTSPLVPKIHFSLISFSSSFPLPLPFFLSFYIFFSSRYSPTHSLNRLFSSYFLFFFPFPLLNIFLIIFKMSSSDTHQFFQTFAFLPYIAHTLLKIFHFIFDRIFLIIFTISIISIKTFQFYQQVTFLYFSNSFHLWFELILFFSFR